MDRWQPASLSAQKPRIWMSPFSWIRQTSSVRRLEPESKQRCVRISSRQNLEVIPCCFTYILPIQALHILHVCRNPFLISGPSCSLFEWSYHTQCPQKELHACCTWICMIILSMDLDCSDWEWLLWDRSLLSSGLRPLTDIPCACPFQSDLTLKCILTGNLVYEESLSCFHQSRCSIWRIPVLLQQVEAWGYDAICLSASSGMGLPDLEASLKSRVSVTAGPSGVGKSSLINAINAQLSTASKEALQGSTSNGKHYACLALYSEGICVGSAHT